ncbi:MAG: M23 family metallopeptidase, partial [Clostridia bacterium]|nr:M23 family metallopeptidase [Clostridia bacterium]
RKGAIHHNTIFSMLKIFRSKFVIKRSYYILFILIVMLATISIYTNIATYRVVNNESYSVFSNNSDETYVKQQAESSITEELQDLNSNNIDTRNNLNSQNITGSTNKNTVVTKDTKETTSVKDIIEPLNFVKPINGEVIKVYSVDKLVFSKTLESWKTHDGVDIKADLGENVKSIEKGIIEKIYEDSFLGNTIIIDHGQGYKSIYSNLDSTVNIKEKQTIKKLTTIGKVGKTSIGEIKDEPHIHFMLMLNNKVIDPTSKIKF